MTKAETIAQITEVTGIPRDKVDAIVLELLISIINALEAHEAVFIKGFGTFTAKLRNETTGRDIRRNREIVVPAHYIPFFSPYADFKNQVRNKP